MERRYRIKGLWVSLAVALTISLPRLAAGDGAITPALFLHSFLYIWPYCFIGWEMQLLLHKYWKPARRYLGGFAVIVVVAGFSFFYDLLYDWFVRHGLAIEPVEIMRRRTAISIRSVVISILLYFLIRYFNLEEEKQQARGEMEQLRQAQLQARLASLKEQLSPHFLFNTLNTLSSLSQEMPVKEYVDQLAQVYRYALQYQNRDLTLLRDEIAFIRAYLHLLQIRLGDAIQVTIDVPEKYLQQRIPPFTLQLLVENAVKHNVTALRKPLAISISCDGAWVVVCNKLQPKQSVVPSTGTGLANILQRYRLLIGKDIVIEQTIDFFKVKLPLAV